MLCIIFRLLNKTEDFLVFLFFIGLFVIGSYGLYDSYLVYRQANDDSILKYKPGYEGESPEKEIQGNMVAWISLEGTGIDYPVMQGETNYEYLNQNPYGEYSLSGSIFLDSRNSADFSDTYSLLYGHHMENGYMFGDLDLYRKKSFFDEHQTGTILIGNEEKEITLVAVLDVLAVDEVIFSPENRTKEEILDKISETSIYKNEKYISRRSLEGDHVIAFSTCKYPDTAERTVVVGVFS